MNFIVDKPDPDAWANRIAQIAKNGCPLKPSEFMHQAWNFRSDVIVEMVADIYGATFSEKRVI